MTDWVFGTVPPIFQAPATQESLHHGRTLDLTREEATDQFNRVALSADRQDSLAEAVNHRLQALGSVDSPSPDVVQSMITKLREILGTPRMALKIDSLSIEDLSLILAPFDEAYPEVRDLAVWELVEHPGAAPYRLLQPSRQYQMKLGPTHCVPTSYPHTDREPPPGLVSH